MILSFIVCSLTQSLAYYHFPVVTNELFYFEYYYKLSDIITFLGYQSIIDIICIDVQNI